MTSSLAQQSFRRPTSHEAAEAYADAVILAKGQDCHVAVQWQKGQMWIDALEPGFSPDDFPVLVGHRFVMLYPWCPVSGVECLDLLPQMSRADIVRLALESGLAEQWIGRLCEDVG